MCCCPSLRILVLIMAVLATACAVCANIFPVFQKKSDTVTMKQTLWYSRTILPGGNETEHKVSKSLCQQYKLFFRPLRRWLWVLLVLASSWWGSPLPSLL
ncbi:hypothetical protein TraAM80_06755 [Trypanosoma rangeli]|uniref:Uncharacterized protein n=1 Tax=Trypanosoma rangeli TaxID=5698 RepID=A0A3R7M9E9_TRYRA|nr:uncharacterized protein TraAM80_06755 [Trypanosoma rangeli]RNF01820.1 hypothetical protein TraAM80_06755 [Trypanosoma rangeli]|eukprot:RNF01820.1 hypothetical protein TraAM80_06755 [Trypanosoma rangeli]